MQIQIKRGDEWRTLTTVLPEQTSQGTERRERTLERAHRMMRRWEDTYWEIRGENVILRLV